MANTKQQYQTTQVAPPLQILDDELYERITRKAYELYQQRGEEFGHEVEDWLTAERLVHDELSYGPPHQEPMRQEQSDLDNQE